MSGWGKNDFIDVSRLRTRINGLLSIIGKLNQYLGEEWQDVFQEDDEEIDAFLKRPGRIHFQMPMKQVSPVRLPPKRQRYHVSF